VGPRAGLHVLAKRKAPANTQQRSVTVILFVSGLFNDALSVTKTIQRLMISEL